ncbi:unnamed protein product [Cyberlindnera jadinii]|uniref:Uncharacterized protein n=1 Tax=Cyberlindnera jadinii (strain ATCC 18201 / CBS 1600 / BCRC 20928 / JCM 3617 / NBRC 0987 / NRRL Y-1542) TaxID=983966 RepID=A0A0H5C1Y2_CYBJN|nr:unnamed protein product [Cyberlindnera jadinii]
MEPRYFPSPQHQLLQVGPISQIPDGQLTPAPQAQQHQQQVQQLQQAQQVQPQSQSQVQTPLQQAPQQVQPPIQSQPIIQRTVSEGTYFPPQQPYMIPSAGLSTSSFSSVSSHYTSGQQSTVNSLNNSSASISAVVGSSSTSNSSTSSNVRKVPRAQTCHKCGRLISRDMSRHMRIHESVSRFKCIYPRENCAHKSGYFNRQYDYKKHLLHAHFAFDDPKVRRFNGLNEKLNYSGQCPCGEVMTADEWLAHITTKGTDGLYICPDLRQRWRDALPSIQDNDSVKSEQAPETGALSV